SCQERGELVSELTIVDAADGKQQSGPRAFIQTPLTIGQVQEDLLDLLRRNIWQHVFFETTENNRLAKPFFDHCAMFDASLIRHPVTSKCDSAVCDVNLVHDVRR